MVHYTSLGQAEARQAIDAIAAELGRRGQAAVIAVADAHGELIALLRLDGARAQAQPRTGPGRARSRDGL